MARRSPSQPKRGTPDPAALDARIVAALRRLPQSACVAFAASSGRRVQPLLMVISTRPLAEPVPADYRQLPGLPNFHPLRLDALPPEQVAALVCRRLGVQALSAEVASLIQEKAQGNPFFSEQLALALRDAGILVAVDGCCTRAPTSIGRPLFCPTASRG